MTNSEKPMNVSECDRYSVADKVVVRRIGSDTLLVPVTGSAAGARVFPINESALTIWNAIVDGGTLRSAAEALVKEYGLDMDTAVADSARCVGMFLDEGLIEIL
jgi:hypothetical protein